MAKVISGAASSSSLFCCYMLLLAVVVLAVAGQPAAADPFEDTVRDLVNAAIKANPRIGPALIRLFFHDSWVNGCDGSVLLDRATYTGSSGVEKNAASNIGLDGFDLIDTIKANASAAAFSCADILAFAARQAVRTLSGGGIDYALARGRKDGVNSSADYADTTLPGSTFSFQQLVDNFAAKGFDLEDLVVLSGAHSIGVCHRSSFADRLPPGAADQISPRYQMQLFLNVTAPSSAASGNPNPTVNNNIRDMDYTFRYLSGYDAAGVNTTAQGVLDNSYYTANIQNMVLLKSDWALTTNTTAMDKLKEYRDNAADWNIDFGNAMAKLSNLVLPAGQHGEIRNNCRVPNANY